MSHDLEQSQIVSVTTYTINDVPINLLCVGCKLHLYLQEPLIYTILVMKLKMTENSKIVVLLKPFSHELYSQQEIQDISYNHWCRMKHSMCFFKLQYIYLYLLLNDILSLSPCPAWAITSISPQARGPPLVHSYPICYEIASELQLPRHQGSDTELPCVQTPYDLAKLDKILGAQESSPQPPCKFLPILTLETKR